MTPSEFQDSMRKSLAPLHALLLVLSILLGSMEDFRLHYSDASYQSADIKETENTNEREIIFEPLFDLVLIDEEEKFTELFTAVLSLQAGQEGISLVSLLLGSYYIALPPPLIV